MSVYIGEMVNKLRGLAGLSYLFRIDVEFCALTSVDSHEYMMPVSVEYVGFPHKQRWTDILGARMRLLTMHKDKFVTSNK